MPVPESDLLVTLTELLAPVAGVEAAQEARLILEGAGEARALAWAQRRAQGAPLGLILGRQAFLGVELKAGGDVLVAREETELLGREVLAALEALGEGASPRLIDMGCGSGNLACALAVAVPRARVWASDITASCVELTRENVALLGLQDRIQVSHGDLFAPLGDRGLEGTMDLVVMNPPYIPSASLRKTHAFLLDHEPLEAFDGGPYGISIVTRLLQEAPAFLKPGGRLFFEFGLGQGRIVQQIVQRNGRYANLRLVDNAQGEPRVAALEYGG